jgi:hypothetical protein
LNLLVFRDGQRLASGSGLKAALVAELERAFASSSPDALAVLLRAGELECSASDATQHESSGLEQVTDAIAAALIETQPNFYTADLLNRIRAAQIPETLNVTIPESFAYYALHPSAFAEVLDKIQPLPQTALVVGIRSIGVTLSAVTVAALRQRGIRAERITVRPQGHPYNRHTEFSGRQRELLQQNVTQGAQFLIVDEGPGLSGSSFLSVAEALVKCGVAAENIKIICSHEPHVDSLRAENGPQRWRKFTHIAAGFAPRLPVGAEIPIGGGEWRQHFLPDESAWPASWINFERIKFLSHEFLSNAAERPRFLKFAGFGHYGEAVFDREQKVAAGGFGPQPRLESDGFVSYPLIEGRPMRSEDLSETTLARLAAYCVFRAEALPSECRDLAPLQQMASHDLQQLELEHRVELKLERPVLCDGRMQPYEWIVTASGQMLKTDSGSHGDDHFFPGPTDIAWDLAGAIVEWRMSREQAKKFLKMYRHASGDDAEKRIADFVTAYRVFRCAYCMMASNALQGTAEQSRFDLAAQDYRSMLATPLRAAIPRP